jgi:C1A family cysteine protease
VVAAEIADDLHNKTKAYGWEYGAVIVRNSNGTFGAFNDVFYTSYSTEGVNHPAPRDGSVVGIVHTHPWDSNTDENGVNHVARYPGERDWAQADKLVAEGGADPSKLSVYIVDPWGVVREFRYVDKAMYLSLQPHEKWGDKALPARTQGCST